MLFLLQNMGAQTAACRVISVVLSICVASGTLASAILEVESNCPDQSSIFEHGSVTEFVKPFREIRYTCHLGYRLLGIHSQTCGADGHWKPAQRPRCEPLSTKCMKPVSLHGTVHFSNSAALPGSLSDEGEEGIVTCNTGYLSVDKKRSFRVVCSKSGMWMTDSGSLFQDCQEDICPPAPAVPNAIPYYQISYSRERHGGGVAGRVRLLHYNCTKGYEMVDKTKENILTCRNGEWEGPIPTCVRLEHCSSPFTIYKGKWSPKIPATHAGPFTVGSEVTYSCLNGYRLVGAETLKCTTDRLWSKIPPICVAETEKTYYCQNIGFDKIDNGYCKCERSESNSLEKCEPFYRETQVRCVCDSGYKLMGSSLLTCTRLSVVTDDQGTWSHEPPYCIRDESKDMKAPMPVEREGGAGGGGGAVVSGTRVSTLVMVIASASSVLGVLVLIMVVVLFRRKKPRPRLFHPSLTPPPYSRVHNNSVLDEHDRLALMAYADATRAHLPTYEEAVQGRGGGRAVALPPGTADYRPLPSIPANLRAPGSLVGGAADNPNRHSTVTTSTMNRDGLSENFGSLDTVNVSMSDASTSVTVETFDSGTSNRSMSSQRATAGSIASSQDNLANDNAPLLDNSGETCEDNSSECSTPNLEQKDE